MVSVPTPPCEVRAGRIREPVYRIHLILGPPLDRWQRRHPESTIQPVRPFNTFKIQLIQII